MTVIAAFFLFPFLFMVITSFKNSELQVNMDMGSLRGFLLYGDIGLQQYRDIIVDRNIGHAYFNSLFITASAVSIGLVVNSMIAYALARIPFRGRKVILVAIIALMIVPGEAIVIPLLFMANAIGWINTYQVQIVPFVAEAMSIFLFYQFFRTIPNDLEEAAIIDGASRAYIYAKIIVPLSRPVFASVAILSSLFRWSEYLWPLMVTRGEKVQPLPIAMQMLFNLTPTRWGDVFAFATLMTAPMLAVFILFQRQFVDSVASTGIKG